MIEIKSDTTGANITRIGAAPERHGKEKILTTAQSVKTAVNKVKLHIGFFFGYNFLKFLDFAHNFYNNYVYTFFHATVYRLKLLRFILDVSQLLTGNVGE